jgi:hypothetical protein|eukprot:jgi/Chrpa1/26535/Chrysochromulina_OHIO_Genome00018118-RA
MLWTLQCSNSAVILSCCRSRTRHLLHHQQSWSSASKGMKTLGHCDSNSGSQGNSHYPVRP